MRAGSRDVLLGDLLGTAFLAAYLVLTFGPFEHLVPTPGSVSTFVVPVLGIAALCCTRTEVLARIPVSLSLLGVVAWSAMSLAWSDSAPSTVFQLRSTLPALVVAVFVIGTLPTARVLSVVRVFFVACAVWSIPASLVVPPPPDAPDPGAWQGTFLHKNLLGIAMVFGLAAVLATGDRSAAWRRWAVAAFVVAALGSRSATVGGGLGALGAAWLWMRLLRGAHDHRSRALLKVGAALGLLLSVALVVNLLPTLVGLYGKDLTFTGRTDIWAAAGHAIVERPWTGYGVGGVWAEPFGPVTERLHHEIGFDAAHGHNGVVDVLLEVGVVGLALYAAFAWSVVRLGIRALRRPASADLGWWVVLTFAPLQIMALAEPLYRRPALGYAAIMWVVLQREANVARPRPAADRVLVGR